jgi:hypothetical protein
MSLAVLFKAWTAVLRGQEDEVPLFHNLDKDPLSSLSEMTPAKKHVLWGRVLKGLNMLPFIVRYIFELIWYREEEDRVIFVPGQFLQDMRSKVLQELTDESNGAKTHFVSDGDVLLSWWVRTMLSALRPGANRTVSIMNIFDIRPTIAEDVVPPGSVLTRNAIFASYTILSTRQILEQSLSYTAAQLRRCLEEQRTREQVQALAALLKEAIEKTGLPPVIGDSDTLLIVSSNWHKGRFFEVDFSAAAITPGVPVTERANKLGRPSYINVTSHSKGISTRNAGSIIGKDGAGNWWLAWSMRKAAWPAVDRQLSAIKMRLK